jgi:hypothetical protein
MLTLVSPRSPARGRVRLVPVYGSFPHPESSNQENLSNLDRVIPEGMSNFDQTEFLQPVIWYKGEARRRGTGWLERRV